VARGAAAVQALCSDGEQQDRGEEYDDRGGEVDTEGGGPGPADSAVTPMSAASPLLISHFSPCP